MKYSLDTGACIVSMNRAFAPLSAGLAPRLFDGEELDVEDEGGVGRDDAAGAARSVTELGRNAQLALAPDFHSRYAFIPAFDHLARAELKHKGLAAIDGAIELLAILGKPAGVMHRNRFAGRCGGAGPFFEIPILQAGRCGLALSGHFGGAGIIVLGAAGDRGEKCEEYKKGDVLWFHGALPRDGIIYHPCGLEFGI